MGTEDKKGYYFFMVSDSSVCAIPKEIIIQEKVISQSDLNKWGNALGKRMPKIVVPKIGEKKKKVDLCIRNSKLQINRIHQK